MTMGMRFRPCDLAKQSGRLIHWIASQARKDVVRDVVIVNDFAQTGTLKSPGRTASQTFILVVMAVYACTNNCITPMIIATKPMMV
jgi:hypothetical protein